MVLTSIQKKPHKLSVAFFLTCLVAACHPTRGCIESQFTLAAESRLPSWLILPAGLERGDVDVQLSYWAGLAALDNVTVYVNDHAGRRVAGLTGRSCWHPATHWPQGGPVPPDPHYVILIAREIVDVAEHSGGNWRMSDNSAILAAAKESIARNECRESPDNY
jgi:hypothetical protein